ncbi:MAG TPA: Fe-S cluster assembly protein SufD [Ignavibacteriaceae bacterium]|nr:Fe-S cluster assembly protein SufD [Ignavibacteriaceae bacterium]
MIETLEIKDIKNWYIENFQKFENSLNGGASGVIHELRKDAISNFSRLDFPTTRNEEWKYTSIAPLLKHTFIPASYKSGIELGQIKKMLFEGLEHTRLVFVNGFFSKGLSDLKDLPEGVIAGSIEDAIKNNSDIVTKHFSKYADYKEQIFTALSTAYTKDGAFIYIPDGKIIEKPIQILYLSSSGGEKILNQPRNLFVAGKNCQVTIIENYSALDDGIYFTNTVTEIFSGENSTVYHIKLQNESKNAFHIARMEVDQERDSNFKSNMISFGAGLSRNDFNTRFNDRGGECELNGLFMIDGEQMFDVHTMIDHAAPYCNSHEHYKGLLDGKSHGVFNGKVMVRRDAQKTNAFQENNNIILSDSALINTKPQLEIFADDVKCSHGATIGQLEEDALFYLKTRGIGDKTARGMLIHAFASDVVNSIKVEAIRNYLEGILTNKFNPES